MLGTVTDADAARGALVGALRRRGGGGGSGGGGGGGGDGGGGDSGVGNGGGGGGGDGGGAAGAVEDATTVRLADFGSAVDAETLQPALGLYPGVGPSVAEETREYQPPEAALGGRPYDSADPRSYDLWSMGVLLLELLLATPHVLPLSPRAEAKLRLRFPDQRPEVLERLRLANALAEFCIAPPAVARRHAHAPRGAAYEREAEGVAAAEAAAAEEAAAEEAAVRGEAAVEEGGAAEAGAEAGAEAKAGAGAGEGAAACGREEFLAAVRRQDPLARLGLELDEQLLDLAWRLLQWRPEARISAAAALRHPALSLGGVEAAGGSTGRELVMQR